MEISKLFDHTLLKADAKHEDIKELCLQAMKYNFMSVCIPPAHVALAKDQLKESDILVCTVIGFPLGYQTSATKAFETANTIELGADEIDMVINIYELKANNDDYVLKDIEAVVNAAKGRTVKVIFETCLLTKEEIVRACQLTMKAGAQFVKTSTGFSTAGANPEDVKLMRQTVGPNFGVKASGGIRSKADLDAMIEAGANRIGASAGVAIMNDQESNSSY